MKLCHISDVHLGYRAYHRSDERGLNIRENDIYVAFEKALKGALELQPDLTLITGDLFHVVRPSNRTIVRAFDLISRFQRRREGKPLLLLGGNHETPRSAEAGCILRLFRNIPGVLTAYDAIEQLIVGDASILCIPSRGLADIEKVELKPDRDSKVNILTIHGLLEGLGQHFSSHPISRKMILKADWDYIAMGDFHGFQKLAPNAAYAGSTEFSTSNIWEEANQKKGFVEFDTDQKEIIFHSIETRAVIDLEPIRAHGLTAEQVNQQIAENADRPDFEDSIVRQRVYDLPYTLRASIDVKLLRELRSKALYYLFDPRLPRMGAMTSKDQDSFEKQLRRTLEDEWREFAELKFEARADKQELVSLGLQYLKNAAEKEGE